jgi:protein-S-isoprenylcysteine O-methyltransferase Ste14
VPPIAILGVVPYFVLTKNFELRHFALGPARFAGIPLAALGIAGYLWCVLEFVLRGHGSATQVYTPTTLVVDGLYRLSRNPIYVSYAFAMVGESVFLGSSSLLLLALAFQIRNELFVRLYEEPRLRKQFGAAYEDYCRRVPRWIPPFSRSSAP